MAACAAIATPRGNAPPVEEDTMRELSSIKPNDRILSEREGLRRAAACRAFWSDHPLNLAFRNQQQAETFSLREFTAFVVAMPSEQFQTRTGGRDAD
jgi:hypothetical protein